VNTERITSIIIFVAQIGDNVRRKLSTETINDAIRIIKIEIMEKSTVVANP